MCMTAKRAKLKNRIGAFGKLQPKTLQGYQALSQAGEESPLDLKTRELIALAVAVTTLGNIGPAFGIVSATATYAPLSDFVKAVLCLTMLLGRLEIFTLLILLRPSFWRKTKRW